MKRKILTVLTLTGVLLAVPAVAFGAGSKGNHSGGGGGGSSSSSSGSTVTVGSGTVVNNSQGPANATSVTTDANGVQTTGRGTASVAADGTVLAVVANGATADGTSVTADAQGYTVLGGNVKVVLGQDVDGSKTAGLSPATIAQFSQFDTTKSMASVLPQTAGYTVQDDININLLTVNTNEWVSGNHVIPLKWTGLKEGMNIQVGFYDNATGRYMTLEVVSVDYAKQTIQIKVPGSGTARILTK